MAKVCSFPTPAGAMMGELLIHGGPTPESQAYLDRTGLSTAMPEIEANCSFVTVALVNYFDGSTGSIFRFAADGCASVVIGAHPAIGETPHDLVAWPLYGNDRRVFATYRQEAELLGIPAALMNQRSSQPLRLHGSPENWLSSGFLGVVVVDPRWGGFWLNQLPGPFVCEDIEHGREIASMLMPFGRQNQVMVPTPIQTGMAA